MVELRRRIQAGANVRPTKKSKKLKGKVLRACVTPAGLYGLETVALTEKQQLGSTNNKNKEGGQKKDERPSLTGRLVRSRMRWAGHLVRMDAGKLEKRAEVEQHQGRRKREATAEMGELQEEGYEKIGGW